MYGADSRWSGWFTAAVICLAVLAVIVSLLDCFVLNPSPPRFDEKYYRSVAEGISQGTYDDGNLVRPPLYPLFLGAVFRLFGLSLTPILIIQSIIRGLVVVLAGMMGRRYVSEPAATIAACILVVYPDLIDIYSRLMTEVLHIPLFLISFYFVERTLRSESRADAVKAGIASGVASLARSISVFLTFLVAIFMVIPASGSGRFSRRKIAASVIMVLLLLVTVSPWTIRNAVVHRGFILVSNDAALNMWLVVSGRDIKDVVEEWNTLGSQAERQRAAYGRWISAVQEDPGFYFRRLAARLPGLVFPGWGVPSNRAARASATMNAAEIYRGVNRKLGPIIHVLLLLGGFAGLLVCERNAPRRNLVLLLIAFFLLVHGSTLVRVRFLLALNVLLAIYAGGLIARLPSLAFRRVR